MSRDAKKIHSVGNTIAAYRSIDKIETVGMRSVVKTTGARVSVKGIERLNPNEAYLFVGNHQSNLDVPLLYTYSPIKMAFVAKKEMEKWPIIGELMKQRGCPFLDRENPREGVKAIQQGIELLKLGESLAIFPEGKRSKSNEMNSFKPGAFRLAIKSGVKVAPVMIKGSFCLMEGNNGKIKPADVEIEFLEPINSKNYKEATHLSSDVETLIRENLNN